MNKFVTAFLVCGALAVSACESTRGTADYEREVAAPYADERTIGHEEKVVMQKAQPKKAERVFRETQRK
jgi:hypothetical protein